MPPAFRNLPEKDFHGGRHTPAELFGTVFGAISAAIGVLQICIIAMQDSAAMWIAPDKEDDRVVCKLTVWMMLILITSSLNLAAWHYRPPPALGTVTMALVRKQVAAGGAEPGGEKLRAMKN